MLNVPGGRPPPAGLTDMMLRRPWQYDPSLNQGPMQNLVYSDPNVPQMPQASANMGGQYRLSPGVYVTREQAIRQYQDQMAQYKANSPALLIAQQGVQNGGNSGAGSFPMQQRERELGYAENRFNAAKDNNLFRGNPIRRFKF